MSDDENKGKLAVQMWVFIRQSVLGAQRGLYRTMSVDILSRPLTVYTTAPYAQNNYYNRIYRSLIKKDDEYINKEFSEMKSYMDHSTLCLLNILASTSFMLNAGLDATKMNYESLETYSDSVDDQINEWNERILMCLYTTLTHNCTGEDVKPTDELEDIFFFKVEMPS